MVVSPLAVMPVMAVFAAACSAPLLVIVVMGNTVVATSLNATTASLSPGTTRSVNFFAASLAVAILSGGKFMLSDLSRVSTILVSDWRVSQTGGVAPVVGPGLGKPAPVPLML